MPQKRRPVSRAVRRIDPAALAEFQAGIRKRYSNEQILEQLRASAERLGRSPTMREFEEDPETTVHPQTVIQHFGTWNAAKREAGLVPRRFAKPDDLIKLLRELGDELGRPPTAKDLDEHRASMPSKSLYWHMFGSLKNALRQAGFDVPVGEERLERAIEQGAAISRSIGRLPKFADWKEARRNDPELMSEWQVYRMLEPGGGLSGRAGKADTASSGRRRQVGLSGRAGKADTASSGRRRQVGAWATFQFLVSERLQEDGVEVSPEGRLTGRPRSPRGGSGTTRPRPARARPGGASPRKRDRA
jgi:hypothetical protein